MLSKNRRLTKRELERVYKKGKSFREKFLLVRFIENRAQNTRFAVVIPKKIFPKATQRVRMRRKTFIAADESIKGKKLDIVLTFKNIALESELHSVLESVNKKMEAK